MKSSSDPKKNYLRFSNFLLILKSILNTNERKYPFEQKCLLTD